MFVLKLASINSCKRNNLIQSYCLDNGESIEN